MNSRYLAVIAIPALLSFWSCRTTSGNSQLQNDQSLKEAKIASKAEAGCEGYSEAVGDPVKWLQSLSQPELEKVFACAPSATSLPSGLGIGRGSLFQTWPLWNEFQGEIGSYIWGGKRLYKQKDGETCLLNQMNDNQTERYMAHVYLSKSNRDSKNVVTLDYRVDKTKPAIIAPPAQLIVDRIALGIRDEIREVMQDGQGSKVYVGRANLNHRAFIPLANLHNISSEEFANPNQYMFAANFILDFRPNEKVAFGKTTPQCFQKE